ncbi:MAG: DinB family protein [Vicinamibacterales bacterium]
MDAQIEGLLHQLQTASQEVPGLTRGLTSEQFNWAPGPGRWSIGQCLEHLNITSERYIPVFKKAMEDGRAAGRLSSAPITLGFLERWFMQTLEPAPSHQDEDAEGLCGPGTVAPGRHARPLGHDAGWSGRLHADG